MRPVVVVPADAYHQTQSPLAAVVSQTKSPRQTPLHVRLAPEDTGLELPSTARIDHARFLDRSRLSGSPAGKPRPAALAGWDRRLSRVLGLGEAAPPGTVIEIGSSVGGAIVEGQAPAAGEIERDEGLRRQNDARQEQEEKWLHAFLRTVTTVMSSFCPQALAASAISRADLPLISRVRSKPNSSRLAFSASTTPSETNVKRAPAVQD